MKRGGLGRRLLGACILLATCKGPSSRVAIPAWERSNPVRPLPAALVGLEVELASLPRAPDPRRVRLGRWLFYDPRLSADATISCASCHEPRYAFSQTSPVATGVDGRKGTRKSPPLVNLALAQRPFFFWDGRADSLEAQVVQPMTNPIEMAASHELIVERLAASAYPRYFAECFGSGEISIERTAHALADYLRTRMSGNSPWDRWKAGDESAVSDAVKRGDALFFGRAECHECHLGPNFTDSQFHNLGIGYDEDRQVFRDLGRGGITGATADRGAFKTPTLREVSRHAPYMHDGSLATLEATVQHYVLGGTPNPQLSDKVHHLQLGTRDIADLVAMMRALDGEGFMDEAPELPP